MFADENRSNFRETMLSYLAGALFAVGWWMWIDANAYSNKFEQTDINVTFGHYVPGIVSTLGLIMVNVVNWKDLGNNWGWEDSTQSRVRAWLFFALVVSFGGIIGAIWSASVHWFNQKPTTDWPGVALILQNFIIFLAAMCYRFAKPFEEEYSSL